MKTRNDGKFRKLVGKMDGDLYDEFEDILQRMEWNGIKDAERKAFDIVRRKQETRRGKKNKAIADNWSYA